MENPLPLKLIEEQELFENCWNFWFYQRILPKDDFQKIIVTLYLRKRWKQQKMGTL